MNFIMERFFSSNLEQNFKINLRKNFKDILMKSTAEEVDLLDKKLEQIDELKEKYEKEEQKWKNKNTKEHIQNHLNDVAFVETLSKYFEKKLKKNKKNAEIRINLTDLIYDLNTLKQYL